MAGVFKDIASNCTLQFESILSFKNNNRYSGWNGGDSYQGYVRLLPNAPHGIVSEKIEAVLTPYLENENGYIEKFTLIPITDLATERDNTPTFLFILKLLASVILLIATFNYILIVLSTVPQRLKSIGIQKSYGASRFDIFKQFLIETAYIVAVAICLAFIIIYLAHKPIEVFTGLTLQTLFVFDNLWLPFVTLLSIALIAGIAPAVVLARASIHLFFSAKTTGNQFWKKILLFIQITGSAIICPLLIAAILQHNYLVNKPLGYDAGQIVYENLGNRVKSTEDLKQLLLQFKALPYVESVATGDDYMLGGYSGNPVFDDQQNFLFTTRVTGFDSSYVSALGIKMVEGRNLRGKGEVLVNETFAKKIRSCWPNKNIIGEIIPPYFTSGVVVGVMKDYATNTNLYETLPLFSGGLDLITDAFLYIRLSEVTPERIKVLNRLLSQSLSDPEAGFTPLIDEIFYRYEPIKNFRNTIGYTTTAILMILFIGLVGYIDNEIARKSKEIAIRKVNGATVWNILNMISTDLSYAAIPASIIGSVSAYPIVKYWMEQFPNEADISWTLFASTGIIIFIIIILCGVLKSWQVANENPIKHLKRN